MIERVYTIGVYGFTAQTFADRLRAADVDLLCDIRARRGVRGASYSFANARRLEQAMEQLGVAYVHEPDLAPTSELRAEQKAVDANTRTPKRERAFLASSFVDGYSKLLSTPEAHDALARIAASARRPALLCVEREPRACHRSLAAESFSVQVVHLTP